MFYEDEFNLTVYDRNTHYLLLSLILYLSILFPIFGGYAISYLYNYNLFNTIAIIFVIMNVIYIPNTLIWYSYVAYIGLKNE
jgi:hypothetical protein